MYNSRERILQFAAEVIPIQRVLVPHIDGETLQTTEWESENGNERCVIHKWDSEVWAQ
jgi:hypothetical protein